jgi:hypothetical protein
MDLYAIVKVVHAIENRIYDFGIPWAAPYEEVYKALDDIRMQVMQMEDNAKALAVQKANAEDAAKTDAGVQS